MGTKPTIDFLQMYTPLGESLYLLVRLEVNHRFRQRNIKIIPIPYGFSAQLSTTARQKLIGSKMTVLRERTFQNSFCVLFRKVM